MVQFTYIAPKERKELLNLKAKHGDKAVVLAGGTVLLPALEAGKLAPEYVIDIKKLSDEYEYWKIDNDSRGLLIGATATLYSISDCDFLNKLYSLLPDAAMQPEPLQIRNRATAVGNILSPAPSDIVSAFLLYDALLLVASSSGNREISLHDFYSNKTSLKPNELIERVLLPIKYMEWYGAFVKCSFGNISSLSALTDGNKVKVAVALTDGLPLFLGEFEPYISAKELVENFEKVTDKASQPELEASFEQLLKGVQR